MRIFSYLLILLVVFFGIVFAALNANVVTCNYYLGARSMPLSLLLVFAFSSGMIFGFIFALPPWLRLKRDKRKLKARVKLLEAEIGNLRNLPIKGE